MEEKQAFFEQSLRDDEAKLAMHQISIRTGHVFTEDFSNVLRRVFTLCLAKAMAEEGRKYGTLPEKDEDIGRMFDATVKYFLESAHEVLDKELTNELKRFSKSVPFEEAFEISTGKRD